MLLAAAGVIGLWPGDQVAGAGPLRVGSIVIQGNVRTEQQRIPDVLHESGIYPAWPLPGQAELFWVEIRLLLRFHKQFDWSAGKRPRLKLLPWEGDPVFHDVEVWFPEMSPKKAR